MKTNVGSSPESVIINKTIGIGDAGLPFDVSIDIDYERQSNVIVVNDWMEDTSPYDNPPESWYLRMREVISEFFYDQDESITNVVFK
jgi:hypothetical protein